MGYSVTWVTFDTRAAFDAYNQQACNDKLIPHPGKRQSDLAVQISNQWTLAHCNPYGVFNSTSGAKILANVPAADVVKYGLSVVPNNPVIPISPPGGTRTIVFEGATRIIFSTAPANLQPKPATWTDPDTGIVYQVT